MMSKYKNKEKLPVNSSTSHKKTHKSVSPQIFVFVYNLIHKNFLWIIKIMTSWPIC